MTGIRTLLEIGQDDDDQKEAEQENRWMICL